MVLQPLLYHNLLGLKLQCRVACWLTCGKVEGIQDHANEGGVTQTHGGIY
ncbi:hypothetical protein AAZX31_18G177100 [Glycine max]